MAAGATYEPIATTTLSSTATSISFSSLGAYTDIKIILVCTTGNAGLNPIMQYNSDTGANYSVTILSGNGSAASSGSTTSGTYIDLSYYGGTSTTIPTMYNVDLFSYSGSTNKTCLVNVNEDKNGSGEVARNVGLWRNTAAITSIQLKPHTSGSFVFAVGTTATLYGIKAA